MALIFNSTTIPQDVANVLGFNGTNIENVYMNGALVWQQSLFSASWSGNSLGADTGLENSGTQSRYKAGASAGAWATVNSSGKWNDVLSTVTGIGTVGIRFSSSGQLNFYYNGDIASKVTFVTTSGFSGDSTSSTVGLNTSSGQIRWNNGDGYTKGDWVTLT